MQSRAGSNAPASAGPRTRPQPAAPRNRVCASVVLCWIVASLLSGCGEDPSAPTAAATADVASDLGKPQFGDAAAGLDAVAKPDVAAPTDASAAADAADPDVWGPADADALAVVDAQPAIDTDAAADAAKDGSAADVTKDVQPACQIGSDCDDQNPCTTNSCVSGNCVYVGNGLCCQSAADCDDGNACTADACFSSGCLHTLKACNDGLSCTVDSCQPANGQCKHAVLAGFCAIDGQCVPTGTSGPGACLACVPEIEPKGWSAVAGKPCDDGVACTSADQCDANGSCLGTAKSGCCTADADCQTTTPCTTASCNTAVGQCVFAPGPDCCASGSCCNPTNNSILPAGSPCGGVVIASEMTCNGSQIQARTATAGCDGTSPASCGTQDSQLVWGPWQTVSTCSGQSKCVQQPGSPPQCVPVVQVPCNQDSACNDSNACTDDLCVQGSCVNLPKLCPAGDTCQTQSCDAKTGTCGLSVLPGACRIDNTCVLAGVRHPTDACKVCDPAQSTSAFSTVAECKCSTPGPCCDAGVVADVGTACDTKVLAETWRCDPTGTIAQRRSATAGCSGPGAVCSPSQLAWGPWKNVQACPEGSACVLTSPDSQPTCSGGGNPVCSQPDPYDVGVSVTTAFDLGVMADAASPKFIDPSVVLGGADDVDVLRYTVLDQLNNLRPTAQLTWQASGGPVELCVYLACPQSADGKSCAPLQCPDGAAPVAEPEISAASVNGCCMSGANGTLAVVPKASGTDHSATVWLRVQNQSTECHKVQLFATWGTELGGSCAPGSPCCEADGTPSPAGTACGTAVLASTWQCSSADAGGSVQRRDAVAGCQGDVASCSTEAGKLVWGPWVSHLPCGAGQVCSVSDPSSPGTCTDASSCAPGSTCCTAQGNWAPAGSWCGKTALQTEYQCSGTAIEVRKRMATCAGGSSSCAPTPGVWTDWQTVSACQDGWTCTQSAQAGMLPSCTPLQDPCLLTDSWEAGTDTASSVLYGAFDDGDAAQWLTPPIRLGAELDKDFLRHSIEDKTSLDFSDPRVFVQWQAAEPVQVCAYYRCWAGAGGEDCDEVECNSGSELWSNNLVSSVSGNGCCAEAASGVIDFVPDAPWTLDESGEVFWNVKSLAPVCQEVTVKLAFGDNSKTDCTPGSTCCTDAGTPATAGSACGATVATQYLCTEAGVSSRAGRGSCSSDGKCQTGPAKLTFSAATLVTPCLSGETCMVGKASEPGQCQVVQPTGSCAGVCGGMSKQGSCYCDALCVSAGDCCSDFSAACGGTCSGACGGQAKLGDCWCDADCSTFGDCCLDKAEACK